MVICGRGVQRVACFVGSVSRVAEFRKRSVGSVSGVGSVGVKGSVAFELSRVASESGPGFHGPKGVVRAALKRTRRAAAEKVQRIQQRLSGQNSVVSSVLCSSDRVALRLCQSRFSKSQSASCSVAVSENECVMLRPSVLSPVSALSLQPRVEVSRGEGVECQSVASVASVGEWRPVGDALRSVLFNLATKVEASTQMSSQLSRQLH